MGICYGKKRRHFGLLLVSVQMRVEAQPLLGGSGPKTANG
jgi:hypothetical protein